jgi:hypothetical protein
VIRVRLAEEPASFNATGRAPGLRAIAEMVGEKPPREAGKRFKKIADRREDIPSDEFPSYWTYALDDLLRLYDQVCAYCCFRIHSVTGSRSVDHFVAKSRRWDRTYEWNNYNLACSLLNARKKSFDDVLDPNWIDDGWFRLELVGFQVLSNPLLHPSTRDGIETSIKRLGLNDFRNERAEDAEQYWSKNISLSTLAKESPFVAKELRRQGRLNPGDT